MTNTTNERTATTTVDGEEITLTFPGGESVTFNVKDVTPVLRVLLPARKQAYENIRGTRESATAEAKAARLAARAEKAKAAADKQAAKLEALRAQLAELEAKVSA